VLLAVVVLLLPLLTAFLTPYLVMKVRITYFLMTLLVRNCWHLNREKDKNLIGVQIDVWIIKTLHKTSEVVEGIGKSPQSG
jgi:hypothetical protein